MTTTRTDLEAPTMYETLGYIIVGSYGITGVHHLSGIYDTEEEATRSMVSVGAPATRRHLRVVQVRITECAEPDYNDVPPLV